MATMSIGAILLLLALIVSTPNWEAAKIEFKAEWNRKTSRIYIIASFILALACALSLLSAKFFPLSYSGHPTNVHFWSDFAKVWYLFWPILLVIGLRRLNLNAQLVILRSWLVTFSLLAVIGIIQYFTGWPRPQVIPAQPGFYHSTLFLGHHLSTASILIFPFFAVLDSAVHQRTRRNTFLLALIALLGLITLLFTYSRTLWLALPIGICIWALTTLPKKIRWLSTTALIVGSLAASRLPIVQGRFFDGIGFHPRVDLWKTNLEFFLQRPLFGVGWRHNVELSGYYLMEKYHAQDVFSGHAHNNFLDILGGTGLVGALSWLFWNGCIFWILLKNKKRFDSGKGLTFVLATGMLCAFLVFQLNGLTQVNFWEAKVQHQLAWVIALVLL